MRRWAPIALLGAASLVGAAVSSARPSDSQLIEHQVQTQSSGSRVETWNDLLTGRRRTVITHDGETFTESVSGNVNGKLQINTIFYPAKTWTTFSPGFPVGGSQTAAQVAQRYRDGVAHGLYKIVGHDQIDGHGTVQLRHTISMPIGTTTRTMTTDLWVDVLTYLPVRQRNSMSGMPSTSEVAYDWLPRTAENLVNLVLVVPDGFTHQTQGPASNCSTTTSSGTWLTFHLGGGGTTTTCSSQVLIGHS